MESAEENKKEMRIRVEAPGRGASAPFGAKVGSFPWIDTVLFALSLVFSGASLFLAVLGNLEKLEGLLG